jgi:5-(carboxyamino)imidazole ribonucleotide mutase
MNNPVDQQSTSTANHPLVGVIMGSDSDLDIMSQAAKLFDEFDVAYEMRVISAHRTPDEMAQYASKAAGRGLQVIIAGAGGSAHLPGMTASHTTLPVIAIPIKRESGGHEAFWSSIKMPSGIPLATMPENGAHSGALLALRILALNDNAIAARYVTFVQEQHDAVLEIDAALRTKGWQSILT